MRFLRVCTRGPNLLRASSTQRRLCCPQSDVESTLQRISSHKVLLWCTWLSESAHIMRVVPTRLLLSAGCVGVHSCQQRQCDIEKHLRGMHNLTKDLEVAPWTTEYIIANAARGCRAALASDSPASNSSSKYGARPRPSGTQLFF